MTSSLIYFTIILLLLANSIIALPIILPISNNDDSGGNTGNDDNLPAPTLSQEEQYLPVRYGRIEQFFQKYTESINTESTGNTDKPSLTDKPTATTKQQTPNDNLSPTEIYINAKLKFIRFMNNMKLILTLIVFILLSSLYYYYLMIRNGWDSSVNMFKKIFALQCCYLGMVAIFCIF